MKVLTNAPLVPYTSLHAGGAAERLVVLDSPEDSLLDAVTHWLPHGPVTVLGFGTNCLVSDKGLPGTTIVNSTRRPIATPEGTRLTVDAGSSWDDVVVAAIKANLWGLETTSGVPGGVAAAVVGNIAAYGQQVADVFEKVELYDPTDGSIKTWHKDDMGFTYRTSILKQPEYQHLTILNVTFNLSTTPTNQLEYQSALKIAQDIGIEPDTLEHKREIVLETRKRAGSLLHDTQTGPWTAGSFFKNPMVNEEQVEAIVAHEEVAGRTAEQVKLQNKLHGGHSARVSAALVLLAAGFTRGQTWGQVRLHPDHILKVENVGHASAQEIYDVVQIIVQTVQRELGITLEPEVRFIGDFS